MPTSPQTLVPARSDIAFHLIDPERDTPLIHQWGHLPHAIPWWNLNVSPVEVHRYLLQQSTSAHSRPWLVSRQGEYVGYAETYRVMGDPLARYYQARDSDAGWHILIGPAAMLGTGLGAAVAGAIFERLFADPAVDRLVCEPDHRNTRMIRFCEKLGMIALATVDLPDKRATLLAIGRDDYESRYESGDR